jgi:hypothetical protein
MTPDSLLEWTLALSVALCVILGTLMCGTSVRAVYLTKAVTAALVGYVAIAGVLLFAPKATTLTIEWKEIKAQVAKLESEKIALLKEKEGYQNQIASLNRIAQQQHVLSALDWLKVLNTAKVSYRDLSFLPAQNDIKMEVTANNRDTIMPAAAKLNTSPEALYQALGTAGFTILKTPSPDELKKQPADSLWVGAMQGVGEKK